MEYQPLYMPGDLSESAFMESLLQSSGIRYFIHGENVGRILPRHGLMQSSFYVHPEDFSVANEIIKDYTQQSKNNIQLSEPTPFKIRKLVSFLLRFIVGA